MWIGLLLSHASFPALAESAEGVVLLRSLSGKQRAAESRVRDELRMTGLRVDEVQYPYDDADVEHIMAERGALTAVRLESINDSYDVVIWAPEHRRAHEVSAQRLSVLSVDNAVVALKVAEVVRRRLFELSDGDQSGAPPGPPKVEQSGVELVPDPRRPVPAELPPSPELTAQSAQATAPVPQSEPGVASPLAETRSAAAGATVGARERRRSVSERWIGLSLALAGGPGGGRSLVGGALNLGWRLTSVFSLQTDLITLVSPVPITPWGVHLGHAAAQFFGVLGLSGARRVMPRLRFGGGPALIWATRDVASSPSVRDVRAGMDIVGILTAGLGVAVRVHPRFQLYAGIDAHILVPPAGVVILNETDREFELRLGPPLLRGTIGLEFILPPRRRATKNMSRFHPDQRL